MRGQTPSDSSSLFKYTGKKNSRLLKSIIMALSTEAILAIIALFISLPPAVFAFYKVRRLSTPSSSEHPTKIFLANSFHAPASLGWNAYLKLLHPGNDYSMLPTILNTPSSDYVLSYTFTERTIEAHLHSIHTGGKHLSQSSLPIRCCKAKTWCQARMPNYPRENSPRLVAKVRRCL